MYTSEVRLSFLCDCSCFQLSPHHKVDWDTARAGGPADGFSKVSVMEDKEGKGEVQEQEVVIREGTHTPLPPQGITLARSVGVYYHPII